ncbi:MAG: hypothetical protein PHE27_07810 [Alphaproteobacteria bacterium]|nr:hypothetical protein [Alphaproteobacteria bacterium]
MTPDWLDILVCLAVLSALGVMALATAALRRIRETFSASLSEMAGHQVRTAQRIAESIAQLQKQQDSATQQIRALADEGVRMQKELSLMTQRLDSAGNEHIRQRLTLH